MLKSFISYLISIAALIFLTGCDADIETDDINSIWAEFGTPTAYVGFTERIELDLTFYTNPERTQRQIVEKYSLS